MMTPNKSGETVTLRKSTIDCVMGYIREELETLLSLSSAVVNFVAVEDTKNLKERDNLNAFRLAELLEDRLGSTTFEKNIKRILDGS